MIGPLAPPTHEDPEALIREARERQLRRRLLSAAGVAIAAALGLGIYAFVGGGTLANVAQPPARGSGATGPPCRASQLSATASLQGATGSMLGAATLVNTSGAACSLPTAPPRVRILWHGRVLPARQVGGLNAGGERPVRVLAPRSKAAIFMQWREWCGQPTEGTYISPTFRLLFRGGLTVDAAAQNMTPPRCDAPGSGTSTSTIAVSRPLTDG